MIGMIHNYKFKGVLKDKDGDILVVIENTYDSFVHYDDKKKIKKNYNCFMESI